MTAVRERWVVDASSEPHPLALEQNLALMAGAGTGKTYSLVTLALHVLGGAREGKAPVRPSGLCMLTFTDKAAGEMRSRLRARLDALATGRTRLDEEVELRGSFSRLALPFPPPGFWRRSRDELGAAAIGTFHSLCGQLLRRAPAAFGVDPAFTLLDEYDSRALLAEVAERVVIDALEQRDASVEALCRDRPVLGQGRASGLADELVSAYQKVREEGASIEALETADPARGRLDFERGLLAWRALFPAALEKAGKDKPEYLEPLRQLAGVLEGLTFDNFAEPGRADAIFAALEAQPTWGRQAEPLKRVKAGFWHKDSVGVFDLYATACAAPLEVAFKSLLVELARRHREALAKKGALDFAELVLRARDLLRDWPEVRREVQGRLGALLVDEFQDTNRLQLELVLLLSERREGAPRPATESRASLEALPLEAGFLCAVGDRKQSIYEFRGADVSVFSLLSSAIEAQGGRRWFLQHNRRSSPALLAFFNRAFAELMQPEGSPEAFDVVYRPEEDDFLPVREQALAPPSVLRLLSATPESAAEAREQEAGAIARWLATVLHGATPLHVTDRPGGEVRAVRGGDVAILFRSFTNVEVYRQALLREGVPHRIVRGRGFYAAQEVMDLASLLATIADPSDALAWAAVLRSPLVGLSDGSLLQVALSGDRPGRFTTSSEGLERLALAPLEKERLLRFLALHASLRSQRDRLGTRLLLKVALEETGYRTALVGTAYGEQALANLEKLLVLAARWDASGRGDAAELSRELLAMAEELPTEAQGDTLDASDPRAVQLLTIHQSKGLEWPVVIAADLGSRSPSGSDGVLLSRAEGLALRPQSPWLTSPKVRSPRFERIRDELARREAAQRQRLLYVSLTRARDVLVLSGQKHPRSGKTWASALEAVIDAPGVREQVLDLDATALVPVRPEPTTSLPAGCDAQVAAALARVRQPPVAKAASAVLPVTHLQNFAHCPRRYRYLHQVGLSEHPVVLAFERDREAGDGEGGGDRRERGTAAHKLLETVDLALVSAPPEVRRRSLEKLAERLGFPAQREAGREIVAWAEAFLGAPFLARALEGGARVRREWPFLVRLSPGELGADGPDLFLKGQIDLLLEDPSGGVTVIDYKSSTRHPAGLSPYAFQLGCYALAAGRLAGKGAPVRAGIAFLREKNVGPDLLAPELGGTFETTLYQQGHALLEATATGRWEGRAEPECASLRCGFRARCHPGLLPL